MRDDHAHQEVSSEAIVCTMCNHALKSVFTKQRPDGVYKGADHRDHLTQLLSSLHEPERDPHAGLTVWV